MWRPLVKGVFLGFVYATRKQTDENKQVRLLNAKWKWWETFQMFERFIGMYMQSLAGIENSGIIYSTS